MIERLLPANVACADTYEADGPPGSLYPEEALLVANSVDKRRHEFAAARACARRAMGDLGLPRHRCCAVTGACRCGRKAPSAA